MVEESTLYIPGGAGRIAHAIGFIWAFIQMGVKFNFNQIVSVSTGALIPIWLERGKPLEELLQFVTEIFSRESEFTLTDGNLLFDTEAFVRSLDLEEMQSHVVVTCGATLQSRILRLNPVSFLASMAIPGVTTHKAIRLNGQDFVDGSINAFPIDGLIRKFDPSEIYLVQNSPNLNLTMPLTREELYWGWRAAVKNPLKLFLSALNRQKGLQESIKLAQNHGIDLKIFSPESQSVHSLENNSTVLYRAADEAARNVFLQFGGSVLPFPKLP